MFVVFDRQGLLALVTMIALLGIVGLTVAFNPAYNPGSSNPPPGAPTAPPSFGHSADEVNVYYGEQVRTLQDALNNLNTGGGGGISSISQQAGGGIVLTPNPIDAITNPSGTVSLLRTCGDGQVLKWNNTASQWECNNDLGGAGGVSISAPSNSGIITSPSTITGVGTISLRTDCGIGEILKWNNQWECDTDLTGAGAGSGISSITINGKGLLTASPGSPIVAPGGTISVASCFNADEVMKWNGTGWGCGVDQVAPPGGGGSPDYYNCAPNAIQTISNGAVTSCVSAGGGGGGSGTVTSVTAPANGGLVTNPPGGIVNSGSISMKPCGSNQVLKYINNVWTCAQDATGSGGGGSGDITGVTAGTGLTGGGSSGDVTVALVNCPDGQILVDGGSGGWVCSSPRANILCTSPNPVVRSGTGATVEAFISCGGYKVTGGGVKCTNTSGNFGGGIITDSGQQSNGWYGSCWQGASPGTITIRVSAVCCDVTILTR